MTKRTRFRLGHLYVVDYNDHYSSSRVYRQSEARDTRCTLRSVGWACHEDANVLVLEHQITTSDRDEKNPRVDVHGIIKSCIVRVQHLGKGR